MDLNQSSSDQEYLSLLKQIKSSGINKTAAKVVKIFNSKNTRKILHILVSRLGKLSENLENINQCDKECQELIGLILHGCKVLTKLEAGYEPLLREKFFLCLVKCFEHFDGKDEKIQQLCLGCWISLLWLSTKSKNAMSKYIIKFETYLIFFKFFQSYPKINNSQTHTTNIAYCLQIFGQFLVVLQSEFKPINQMKYIEICQMIVKNNQLYDWLFTTFLDWSKSANSLDEIQLNDMCFQICSILAVIRLVSNQVGFEPIKSQIKKNKKISKRVCKLISLPLSKDPRYCDSDINHDPLQNNDSDYKTQIKKWNKCAYLFGEHGIVSAKSMIMTSFDGVSDWIGMYVSHSKKMRINIKELEQFVNFHVHVVSVHGDGYLDAPLSPTITFLLGIVKKNREIRAHFQGLSNLHQVLQNLKQSESINIDAQFQSLLESIIGKNAL